MPKKLSARTLIESQYVKGSKTLVKSARQQLSNFFLSLWKEINLKNFVLVVSEIMKSFVNILTPDDEYSYLGKASV